MSDLDNWVVGDTLLVDGKVYTSYSKAKSRALITGINGQDGSYLAEWLLHKGYEVHGIVRRASTNNLERIRHILDKIILHEGDITDSNFVKDVVNFVSPSEIYNLAAQSHVHTSFSVPDYTFRVNTVGLMNILEAIKTHSFMSTSIKIYQASTSEMFGNSPAPQGIDTPFDPQSPYAISKLSAHELIKFYRETYGIYAVSGILFNHESPRRGEQFVTRKITKYFSQNLNEFYPKLQLGNINACRDWGFAPDYVKVMWESLQLETPKDFVLGTGIFASVKTFLFHVGEYVGVNWEDFVEYNNKDFIRDAEVNKLQAVSDYDVYSTVIDLIRIMIDYDANKNGQGYKYYMENYGDIFAWRT